MGGVGGTVYLGGIVERNLMTNRGLYPDEHQPIFYSFTPSLERANQTSVTPIPLR